MIDLTHRYSLRHFITLPRSMFNVSLPGIADKTSKPSICNTGLLLIAQSKTYTSTMSIHILTIVQNVASYCEYSKS